MQQGIGFAVFQKIAGAASESVDQPPLLSPLKCLLDHLERAPPLVALDLIGHRKKDTH
ncbi:hypothetical protein BSY17_4213 (plasmid) [Sphingobium sp. RAC03]|nr:hypothetical protein BSY17_4213 [Sphingobium sp. RAC03]